MTLYNTIIFIIILQFGLSESGGTSSQNVISLEENCPANTDEFWPIARQNILGNLISN